MTIQHIVLSGGGIIGLMQLGVISELIKNNYIKYNEIKSIYGTSAGSIIGLFILLNCDYSDTENYIINRPFEKINNLNLKTFINIFINKTGYIDCHYVKEAIRPLILASKYNLNENSTLLDLYNETKINFNLIATEAQELDKTIFNHLTFPNITIYKALLASSGIMGLTEIIYYENKYYIDGGLTSNCPVMECLENEKCKIEDILILDNTNKTLHVNNYSTFEDIFIESEYKLEKKINLIEFTMFIINNIVKNYVKISAKDNYSDYYNHNYINCAVAKNIANLILWKKIWFNTNKKKRLINTGKILAQNFIKKKFDKTINIYDICYNDFSNNYLDISNFMNNNKNNFHTNIDLSNIDLSNIDLSNIDLSNIDLSNIDLSNIDLSNIDLSNIEIW